MTFNAMNASDGTLRIFMIFPPDRLAISKSWCIVCAVTEKESFKAKPVTKQRSFTMTAEEAIMEIKAQSSTGVRGFQVISMDEDDRQTEVSPSFVADGRGLRHVGGVE